MGPVAVKPLCNLPVIDFLTFILSVLLSIVSLNTDVDFQQAVDVLSASFSNSYKFTVDSRDQRSRE